MTLLKVVAVNKEFEEEKKKQELENSYSYDDLIKYAFYYRDVNDKEREKIYNKDYLGKRFNITLEDFKLKCEEEWKNYERTFDEHDEVEEEQNEDYELGDEYYD